MNYDQQQFDIRFEWGMRGVEELAPISDAIIIVDILSFSTCVDIATRNGAVIYPYRWKDKSAVTYAKSLEAELANTDRNFTGGYTLSPASLLNIKPQTKLILPSPNGSGLSLATKTTPTICGSLRNCKAVAQLAMSFGRKISVVPAGERWADQALRAAFEDLIGAGAVISYLSGSLSPESKSALCSYQHLKANLLDEIKNCSSGKELVDRGFENDINLACEVNISDNAPLLINSAYVGQRNTATNPALALSGQDGRITGLTEVIEQEYIY